MSCGPSHSLCALCASPYSPVVEEGTCGGSGVKTPPASAGGCKFHPCWGKILAWEIPWTEEESGRLQSLGSQRVSHNIMTRKQQHGRVAGEDRFTRDVFLRRVLGDCAQSKPVKDCYSEEISNLEYSLASFGSVPVFWNILKLNPIMSRTSSTSAWALKIDNSTDQFLISSVYNWLSIQKLFLLQSQNCGMLPCLNLWKWTAYKTFAKGHASSFKKIELYLHRYVSGKSEYKSNFCKSNHILNVPWELII